MLNEHVREITFVSLDYQAQENKKDKVISRGD